MEPEDTYLRVWLRRSSANYEAGAVNDIGWLYGKYAPSMHRLAMFITGSADDAEDAVADVFARLSAKPNSLRADDDPKPYLLSAVRNASYSILRHKKNQVTMSDSMLEYVSRAEYGGAVDARLDAAEIMERLALLPVEQREVVVLKTFEQLTFRDIAELSGRSINTIMGRYRSAIASLRKSLEDDGYERAAD